MCVKSCFSVYKYTVFGKHRYATEILLPTRPNFTPVIQIYNAASDLSWEFIHWLQEPIPFVLIATPIHNI